MRKLLTLLIALAAVAVVNVSAPAHAFGCQGWAQTIGGNGCNSSITPVASYQGPGDVFNTSPIAAYSCAEAYTAAYASAAGNACDLVDSAAPTTVICTLKFTATGKVDLASASCVGSIAPQAKCAAATGGVCNISKAYDQTGNGRDAVQTTAANQPTLLFSSTPNGALPAINCGNGTPQSRLETVATVTQTQPFTYHMVAIRNGNFTTSQGFFGSSVNNGTIIGGFTSADTWQMYGGFSVTGAATDNAWHAGIGLANGASGFLNIDGTETGPLNSGTINVNAETLRLCRAGTLQASGLIAEAIFWGAATTPTNRNAISANAHSSGRYNF